MTTTDHVANTLICCPESEVDDYAQHHPRERIVPHPDFVDGKALGVIDDPETGGVDSSGILRKRGWMCDRWPDLFMLDDDVIGLYRIWRQRDGVSRRRRVTCSPKRAHDVIQQTADLAQQLGAYVYTYGAHANPVT